MNFREYLHESTDSDLSDYGIKKLTGATIDELIKKFPWLEKAKIKDAVISVKKGKLIWQDGIWQDGIWEDGDWMKGLWKDGTWEYGTWHNGTWEDGRWTGGEWKKGTWKDGTFEDDATHPNDR